LSVAVAIVGLAFLVLIHEAGHFFTARAVGMRPRKFYLGFPPALVKTTRRGIEYGIGAIPLGGYVRIPGMHKPAPSDLEANFNRALREEPRLLGPFERVKRPLATEELHAAYAALPALRAAVEQAELTPAALHGAERSVNDLDDGLAPDAYWRQKPWKKIAVIFAGPATNLVFAVVVFTVVLALQGQTTAVVDQVVEGQPAVALGLQPGDRIVAIDGKPVTASGIRPRIEDSHGRPITVTVVRRGQTVVLGPVAAAKDSDGVYRLGFVLRADSLPVGTAAWRAVKLTAVVTREIGKSLLRLAHGEGRKQVSSPVGIVRASSHAAQQGWVDYVAVLGFISLSLALLNLLPLLPLDGGHIAFSIVEKLRGKAIGREVYERVSAIGLALVLLLFFVGLSNDVGSLGGG
jgi:membrane-associated protease RseP (regulator of RpoE activity)